MDMHLELIRKCRDTEASDGQRRAALDSLCASMQAWIGQPARWLAKRYGVDADDLRQEALLPIGELVKGYDEKKGTFETWVIAAMRNKAIDVRRKEKRPPGQIPDEFDTPEPAGESAELRFFRDGVNLDDGEVRPDAGVSTNFKACLPKVKQVCGRARAKCRRSEKMWSAFVLAFTGKLLRESQQSVAGRLGITEAQVSTHKAAAVGRIKEALDEAGLDFIEVKREIVVALLHEAAELRKAHPLPPT